MALAWAMAMPLGNLHPYFSIKHILPPALDNIAGIGGIDLFANGDGVICTWGGSQKTAGEVHILPGLATAIPGAPVKIDGPLREALGLRMVIRSCDRRKAGEIGHPERAFRWVRDGRQGGVGVL